MIVYVALKRGERFCGYSSSGVSCFVWYRYVAVRPENHQLVVSGFTTCNEKSPWQLRCYRVQEPVQPCEDINMQQSLDLASYIAALPQEVKSEVFSSPWTTQALFRALAPLAQQYILRLLYVETPLPKESIQLWVVPTSQQQHSAALQQLQVLALLSEGAPGTVLLHPGFRACLRAALAGRAVGRDVLTRSVCLSTASMQHIAEQASRHWQRVLLYVLDSKEGLPVPEGQAVHGLIIHNLLRSAGLIEGARSHSYTAAGFRYLLKSTNEQVWILLREYIKTAEQHSGKELASTLSFLMQLSFRRVWQPYPLQELGPAEQDIALHMAQLGLVHTCKQDGASYFCVTPLAASLCGGSSSSTDASPSSVSGDSSAYIIVETNFRVYAHTSNPLQRKVLKCLMREDCVLPNLFVGSLTRDTFLAALEQGITAADVTAFLQQHAHPQVAKRVPSVPENVQEQLVLWESETRRVVSEPAYLYNNFEDDDLFYASSSHAHNLQVCLWVDQSQQMFAVSKQGHEPMKGFIVEYKRQREKQLKAL